MLKNKEIRRSLFSTFLVVSMIEALILACDPTMIPTRIIRQTEETAIIQGKGTTKVEAKLAAEDEAKRLIHKPNTRNPD